MNTQDFERIKNEVAKKYANNNGKQFYDWDDVISQLCVGFLLVPRKLFLQMETEAAMQFAKERCERQKVIDAEKATLLVNEYVKPESKEYGFYPFYKDKNYYVINDGCHVVVDKESILNSPNAVDLPPAPVKTDKG